MSKVLKNFVGIDISKLFFDVAVITAEHTTQHTHRRFKQSIIGFEDMKDWLVQQDVLINDETLFCMEYTGIYNTALVNYLCDKKALVWVEMAMRIKKTDGFARSSNDKTDAIKIAKYAFRYQEDKQLWSPTDASLGKLKHLIAQRDRIVETISKLVVPVNELKEVGCLAEAKLMEGLQKTAIVKLEKVKSNIESAIEKTVNQDKTLCNKVNRIKTIKGVGQVTAVAFLIYTKGFKSFENGKKLSCYCGTVPFIKKQSGSSVHSKARVSPFANQKLKKLLHLCALSAIQYDEDLKTYYERKVLEGKNKMSVINAVRNKLVLRMFAVVRDDRDYVEKYQKRCA